jgi:DMSO reductase family type II enzyme chaperone
MPTQSKPAQRGEWAARTSTPKRSVFGNYRADEVLGVPSSGLGKESPRSETINPQPSNGTTPDGSPSAIDLALARSFIHRFLAKCYEDPTPEGWQWLCAPATQASLHSAWEVAQGRTGDSPAQASAEMGPKFKTDDFGSFLNASLASFGHAARGSCPLNEIEYGDIKADPLFQPHRLADLAAFYRAFGLEVTDDAGERQDHLCLELEFMCVLAAKEAYALEHQLGTDQLAQCRDAQKQFLREHLGRWTPAFTRRLTAATSEPTLRALAKFTRAFIESDCAHFGVHPGSEELSLRPVDEAADRMCDSCGIHNLPPGVLAAT